MKFTASCRITQVDSLPIDHALIANATRRYLAERNDVLFAVPQFVLDMCNCKKLSATELRDAITACCIASHSDVNGKPSWPKWLRLMFLSCCTFSTLASSLKRLEKRGMIRAYNDVRQVFCYEPSELHLPSWLFAGGLFSSLTLQGQKVLLDLVLRSGPAWFAVPGRAVEGRKKAFRREARGQYRSIALEAMRYLPPAEMRGRSRQRASIDELRLMGLLIPAGDVLSGELAGWMLCLNPLVLEEPFRQFLAFERPRREAYFDDLRRKNTEAKRLCRLGA